jgi:acyl carrier protein
LKSATEVRQTLREWVLRKARGVAPEHVTGETLLLEQRLITSLHIAELIMLVERLSGASVNVRELTPKDFESINAICARFFSDAPAAAAEI